MKRKILVHLMLSILILLTIDTYSQKVYFLHHSTGGAVYSQGHVADKINTYNSEHGTNIQLDEFAFPNNPYPWDNYPYDYWNLWVNGACNSENSNIECLESMLDRYDIIIFKHCFPGSNIVSDIATPNVSSDVKCLANYKLQYRALRTKMDAFPNKKFIVWTLAPLHRLSTNEEKAQRSREFINWVKNDWLTEDNKNHPNIFIFDFFNIVAENNENPQQGKINCLKYEYEKNHNGRDSHPNEQANIVAGEAFAQFIITTASTIDVTGVNLNMPTISIAVGNTQQLTATVIPTNATNKNINWSSSDNSIATINATGKVTAVTPGTATITAKTEDGDFTATCTVTVTASMVNMSRYITLAVTNGADIKLNLAADADNTPVQIVSGANTYNITVGTTLTGEQSYTASTTTMTIYGDIKRFVCKDNRGKITNLNVNNNIALTELDCRNNQLNSLDVNNCTILKKLYCSDNKITDLNTDRCLMLTYLSCYDNLLTNFDVSDCVALTKLYCSDNKITELDVSNNTKLTHLSCSSNSISSLDVSNNTVLKILKCHSNQLTTLDVSKNIALEKLYCYKNLFTTNALDLLYCSLPNKTGLNKSKIYPLRNTSDDNHATVLATNKQNAINKNWSVRYFTGNANIPTTNGTYVCGNIAVTGVSLTPITTSITVDNTQQLIATVLPTNATNKNVIWSTSNQSITTVDNNGLVTAIAPGTATITVKTEDGNFTANCNVTIENITPSTPTITVSNECGYSVLTASNYSGTLTWSTGATTANITVTNTGTYSITQTINGITSLPATVYVNIRSTSNQTISHNSCGSFTWNGQTYTQTGNYKQTFTAKNGCDSIVTLNLTINESLTTEVNQTTCDSFTWNRQTYTQTGNYKQTFTAKNGCDSIVTLNLTINESLTTEVNQTACDSFTWNRQTYTQTGNYKQTLTAKNGCDSVVTLNLTINESLITEVNQTACDSFTWNRQTYTQTGNYKQIFTAKNGCDSIVTLNLTIWQTPNKPTITAEEDTLTASIASKYYWFLNDQLMTEKEIQKLVIDKSGNYSVQIENNNGCKSEISDKIYVVYSSVEDQEVRILIYPNPVTDKLTIEGLPTTTKPKLRLYNVMGELILGKQCTNSIEKINMSDQVAGVYLLKIVDKKVSRNIKIVKK